MTYIIAKALAILLAIEAPRGGSGDGGKSIGPYQIQACVVTDYNRRNGTGLMHWQMKDERTARAVAADHLMYYGGRAGCTNAEQLVQLWQHGPTGYRRMMK